MKSSEMFGNQQDTCLLLNSLLSAVKGTQSEESDPGKKFDLDNEDDAVTIISSTINALSRNTIGTSSVVERLNKQLLLQRRCHAAIFFTVLRSNGINCAEASKYYESVAHSFPTLSWKFYMKLNFQCKWSEYFVECSQELEPDILSAVLKRILYTEWNDEEHLKYYSWHTVLQAIIWKFFIIEDSTLNSSQDCCSFAFPFASSNVKTEASSPIFEKDKDSFAKSQLLHSYVTLLNHLHSALISSLGNFDFIKIIFHAYKTIFRLLSKVKTCEKDVVKELFRLNKLLGSCCSEKQSLDVIEAVLQRKNEQIPLGHYYAVTSWEISANYLMFLLCNYWSDVLESISEEAPYFSLEECLPASSEKELLRSLGPFFKTKFEKDDSNYILSLRIIITLHYPCATRAAVILLLHPEVRESDEVLIILEREVPKLGILEIYPVLADAVATAHIKDAKMRLLNLFFKILSESSGNIYNDALEFILNHYGVNDHFRLDDFDDQLNCFTRKMMSDEEAEKCLLPLFIQSPREVLKMLIEQALLQGSNEITVIKILKHIPVACLRSDSLVEELKPYFIKNEVIVKEMNSMASLIESLMKIHAETSIVDFNMFLQEIITKNLAAEKKVSFTLECLNVQLSRLMENIENETYLDLENIIKEIQDKIIILCYENRKNLKHKNGNEPWFTKELEVMKSKVRALRRGFQKTYDDVPRQNKRLKFKKEHAVYKQNCSKAKDSSFRTYLSNVVKDCILIQREASLNVLDPKNVLKIKTEALSLLIQCLSSIIDKCIKLGDGRVKELAVTTLSILSKCQGITDKLKTELWDDLSSYSPSVLVYISKFLGETSYNDLKGSESKLNDSLWIWCCNFKDSNLFQETVLEKKIPYEELVSVLISVLPHLTKEEWFESTHLIGEYVRNSNIEVSYPVPWLLPKSDPQLYAVIRCLMDSYYFALKKGVYDLNYLSNCFSNTIQMILSQEVNLHLYLNVFLDTCHLTLDNTDEVYTSLLPFLLTVKKSVQDECKDKHLKTLYLKLMHHGIKSLPNSEEKLPFFTGNSEKNLF
ncbi:hypothetical protein AVEN_79050-1 [Araneus ventricosus]|uniref:Uncharacterized protein n=1 Tax=Araneus ventricosus TaxID=182803 RepID=A0A4Y2PJT2_ARAVE|nr:hypothetical protein AVEN_79050-1 [Araneus ventricosus]